MSDIESTNWSGTAASNNAATPDGWPENQSYGSVNNCAREMMGAIKREWDRTHFTLTSGGTADAQTLTPSPAIAGYLTGQMYGFIAGVGLTNTGAATLNVSAKGATAIKRIDGSTALSAGDITAGNMHLVVYDGTNFRLLMPQTNLEGADLDITNTTALTAPATGDKMLVYDASATANRAMTLENTLKVINELTADASPDSAADYVVTYDASASAAKKVLLSNLGSSLTAASQAQMETATSTAVAVTPGRTQYHPGVAKAWCKITMSGGTPTLGVSHNVTSVSDNGPGLFTINFTTAFSSANYVFLGSGRATSASGGGGVNVYVRHNVDPLTTACAIQVMSDGGAVTDTFADIYCAFYGDQ